MAKTEIPSEQISNDDVRREDLNTSIVGQAVTTKVTVGGIGISETHDGADTGTGDVELTLKADGFGMNQADISKTVSETVTGNTFETYSTLAFSVTDSATNKFRINSEFVWGHNSASNDIRVRVLLDGGQIGPEIRIEAKDAGTDQRYQNNILSYVENLSIGAHSIELQYRPASSSRVSRMYSSVIETWRMS